MTAARIGERHESLWMITIAPGIWAAHFMMCYVTAAVWCAKQPTALAPLEGVRVAVIIYTAAALAGIAFVGWRGYRAHRLGDEPPPHDEDTPEDRHRFMGFATVLLSGLSAVAVIYAGLVALFLETCQ
jgi:hypothetical protein